jgi:hypothetical protein
MFFANFTDRTAVGKCPPDAPRAWRGSDDQLSELRISSVQAVPESASGSRNASAVGPGPLLLPRDLASFHHASRCDKPSTDTAWVMTRNTSFKPTSRRSSHASPARQAPFTRPRRRRLAKHQPRWRGFSARTASSAWTTSKRNHRAASSDRLPAPLAPQTGTTAGLRFAPARKTTTRVRT